MSDAGICAHPFDRTVCVAPLGHSGPHITSNARFPHGLVRLGNGAATPGRAAEPPPASSAIWAFLLGEGPLDGVWFGERPGGKPAFWWRTVLRGELTRLMLCEPRATPPETAALVEEINKAVTALFREYEMSAQVELLLRRAASALASSRAEAPLLPHPSQWGPLAEGALNEARAEAVRDFRRWLWDEGIVRITDEAFARYLATHGTPFDAQKVWNEAQATFDPDTGPPSRNPDHKFKIPPDATHGMTQEGAGALGGPQP